MIRNVLLVALCFAFAASAGCAPELSDTFDDPAPGDEEPSEPGPAQPDESDEPDDESDTGTDEPPPRPIPEDATVYAHGPSELFRIDPETLEAVSVGLFRFDGEPDRITDIAIDKRGVMTGVSLDAVYAIDPETAEAELLSTFADGEGGLTSLSYVPIDIADPDGAERLVAADFDGNVWELSPATGGRTLIGNYNQTSEFMVGSSGDIVAVVDFGIVATVNVRGERNDFLARIDPVTWQATLLGDTGQNRVFGIGYWQGQVYGFTGDSTLVTLDASTGEITSTQDSAIEWWGAGVTTLAPVVE